MQFYTCRHNKSSETSFKKIFSTPCYLMFFLKTATYLIINLLPWYKQASSELGTNYVGQHGPLYESALTIPPPQNPSATLPNDTAANPPLPKNLIKIRKIHDH